MLLFPLEFLLHSPAFPFWPVRDIAMQSQQCHSSFLFVTHSVEQTPNPASHQLGIPSPHKHCSLTLLCSSRLPAHTSHFSCPSEAAQADIFSQGFYHTQAQQFAEWLTANTFCAALCRRNSLSSPQSCWDTRAGSGISLQCARGRRNCPSAVQCHHQNTFMQFGRTPV